MPGVKMYTDEQLRATHLRTERERRRRTREAASNHRKPWTEDEVELLVSSEGAPLEEIAVRLGRSYTAVENKRRWLERQKAARKADESAMRYLTERGLI